MTNPHETGSENRERHLVALAYDELRRLARHYMAGERSDHTLQPTALVHEAWLRLIRNTSIEWRGRTHFLAIAAGEMRRALVDHARAHAAQKRGGEATRVALSEQALSVEATVVDVLILDSALGRLSSKSDRQARVAELRLFSGLSICEVAGVLEVSERTVKYDWQFARAFLARELDG